MDKIKENQKIIIGAVAVLLVAVVAFVMFKKSGKTLTCTMNNSQGTMKMDSDVTVKFNGDRAKSVKAKMEVNFGENGSVYATMFKKQMESEINKVKTAGGKATMKTDGGKVTIEMSAENKGLSSVTGSSKESYKEIKKSLEKSGYTCK